MPRPSPRPSRRSVSTCLRACRDRTWSWSDLVSHPMGFLRYAIIKPAGMGVVFGSDPAHRRPALPLGLDDHALDQPLAEPAAARLRQYEQIVQKAQIGAAQRAWHGPEMRKADELALERFGHEALDRMGWITKP